MNLLATVICFNLALLGRRQGVYNDPEVNVEAPAVLRTKI